MADEKKLLPVINLDQAGIIKDVPGHILPPNAFTDGKNIFFKNESVHKRKGTIKAFDNAAQISATLVSAQAASTPDFVFDIDPALSINAEFTISGATPSAYNGTYTVSAISEDRKTITVSESTSGNGVYTGNSGSYSFTPVIDFIDYWPAPNNPQYIEIQRNTSITPNTPVFNSIRSSGIRERIALHSFTIKGITANSTTPTIVLDGKELQQLLAGDELFVFGCTPNGYDKTYTVTSVSYDSANDETDIVCSVTSATPSTAYTADSGNLRQNAFSILSYDGITSQDWQSTFFAGGYAYIINDGYHTPHYLLASLGSSYTPPALRPLPGWDWQRAAGSNYHISAKVIRGYKNVLIAGNLSEYPITNGEVSLNKSANFPGTIRISTSAAAGEIPATWEPGETTAFADEFELSTTSAIQDIVPLQGVAMVYTTDSIHSIRFDSRGLPSVQTVAEGYGALETGCVLEFDGKHVVVGADDIYMFSGHPGNIQSICDGKIRNYFYNRLSPTPSFRDNIFLLRDSTLDEIHIYFPNKLSTDGSCNEFLAWNYRNNTWSINDCSDLLAGTLGPVRGGGVAGGTLTLAGVGNTSASAQNEQQSITVNLDSDYPSGTNEIQAIDYSSHASKTAATYDEEKLTITVPTDIIPFEPETFTFVLNSAFNSGASSVNGNPVSPVSGTTDSGGLFNGSNTLSNLSGINASLSVAIDDTRDLSGSGNGAGVISTTSGNAGNVTVTDATITATQASSGSWSYTSAPSNIIVTGSGSTRTLSHKSGSEVAVQVTVTEGSATDTDIASVYFILVGSYGQYNATGITDLTLTVNNVDYDITHIFNGLTNSFITDPALPSGLTVTLSWYGGSITATTSGNAQVYGTLTGTATGSGLTGITASVSGGTFYSLGTPSYSSGWSQNAPSINTSTGVVSFPEQTKALYDYAFTLNSGYIGGSLNVTGGNGNETGNTINNAAWVVSDITKEDTQSTYTFTNGSGVTLYDVDFSVGSESFSNRTVFNGASLTLPALTSVGAESYNISFGTAANWQFTSDISGHSSIPSQAQTFSPNINEYAAANEIVDYINNNANVTGLTASIKGNTDPDSRTVVLSYINDDPNADSNIALVLNAQDGENVTSAQTDGGTYSNNTSGFRDAQGGTYTQYRIVATDSDGNEVFDITPQLTSSNSSSPALIAGFLKDSILAQANASNIPSYPWYDAGTSGNTILIGTNDMEDYSFAISTVVDEGQNTTLTFSDVLSADSTDSPDVVVIKDPSNNTIATIRPRSGENFESILDRAHTVISGNTTDGWNSSINTTTDVVTLTATAAGRYPAASGPATDATYTDYAVFQVQTTAGSNVNSAGNLPSTLNGSITTQGSGDSVKITLVDPSRTNSGGTGPYEEDFYLAGQSSSDIASSIAAKVNANWSSNWSASAASNVVTFTSTTNDWVLKNRTDSGVTVNDALYANRALFIKTIAYDSKTEGSNSNAESGSFTSSSQSADFAGASVQVGHPAITPTDITVTVNYSGTSQSTTVSVDSAADNNAMASSVATRINSAAIPALGASAASNVVTITTNDLTQAVTGITVTFDEQSTQSGRNAVLRSGGNNLSGTSAAPSTTLNLSTTTDADRPYATTEFDLNIFYPIICNETSILAENFGYASIADPVNDVAGTAYVSYVERVQLPIDNSVEYKKTISYLQLLVDEGDIKVKLKGSDAPGETIDFSTLTAKSFDYDDDYKIDFRDNGRVFNIRIEDPTATSTTPWRVSGYGFKTEGAESRGKN